MDIRVYGEGPQIGRKICFFASRQKIFALRLSKIAKLVCETPLFATRAEEDDREEKSASNLLYELLLSSKWPECY